MKFIFGQHERRSEQALPQGDTVQSKPSCLFMTYSRAHLNKEKRYPFKEKNPGLRNSSLHN